MAVRPPFAAGIQLSVPFESFTIAPMPGVEEELVGAAEQEVK